MLPFGPEGLPFTLPTSQELRQGMGSETVFRAPCIKCDEFHNLHVDLGEMRGVIPREEASLGVSEGTASEYAILSRVGKPVCFQILAFDSRGTAILSRRAAQQAVREHIFTACRPGDVIDAVVQNPADFGVFCDIGCGFTALMRIDRCCVSRLGSTAELFRPGQKLRCAILSMDAPTGQVFLTGRELLGTWAENAARFRTGQTVPGMVRSVMNYGIFVELTPNLSGLAEPIAQIQEGDPVSVYIRAIQEGRHKIKLNILEKLQMTPKSGTLEYFNHASHLDQWEYYPGSRYFTVF